MRKLLEYYEVVQYNLGLASQECVNIISEGIALTEEFLKNETGRTYVSELYKLVAMAKFI